MKKNNEEIKERLLKAKALSDEELEQVVGGVETYDSLDGLSYTMVDNFFIYKGILYESDVSTLIVDKVNCKTFVVYFASDGSGTITLPYY